MSSKVAILLLLSLLVTTISGVDDDLDGFDELLAIDAEDELSQSSPSTKPSAEADVASRAQRIVLELSNDNAKKIIDSNEMVLLLGYAPWCPRSAELMPRFAEAALKLREIRSGIVMAKIDAERFPKAAGLVGIEGFPTVLLFVNGSAQSYSGGFTAEDILIWVRKKIGIPVIQLSSVPAAEEFLKQYKTFVVGYFQKFEGPEYREFVKAAISNNDIQFVEVSHIDVADILFPGIRHQKHFIGLIKSDPERFEKFEGNFEEEDILQFIEYHKFPLVTTLTELNSAIVFSSPIKFQVLIFAEIDDFSQLKSLFQEAARKYKTKIMFIYVDSAEENLARPFLTLLGLEPEKPIVAAFDNKIGAKYLLESEPTMNNLEEFCSKLVECKLPQYYKSEPIPDKSQMQMGMVEKVVGRTFDSSILGSSKNCLLEVYTPWCIDCEATSKLVGKLAKHFKGLDNLKIARIDASMNEHPKLQVNNYPTLLFYPIGDKTNPIQVSKKLSLKDLADFVEENVKAGDDRVSATREANRDEL